MASLDPVHLARVKRAVERFEPALVSEHACWGHAGGEHFNDLLPLPYTEEAVEHLAARVRQVQDFLGRQILVENLSSYFAYTASSLTEWDFLAAVVERSGCGLLLDVNNIYVNSINLGLDAERFIASVPAEAVQEIHLAGHRRNRVGDSRPADRRSRLRRVRGGLGALRARDHPSRTSADADRVGYRCSGP